MHVVKLKQFVDFKYNYVTDTKAQYCGSSFYVVAINQTVKVAATISEATKDYRRWYFVDVVVVVVAVILLWYLPK